MKATMKKTVTVKTGKTPVAKAGAKKMIMAIAKKGDVKKKGY